MNKIKDLMKKASIGLAAAAFFLVGSAVKAAPDADYASGTELIKTTLTDNKSTTILYVAGIVVITLIVGLTIKALFFGKRQALGMFGGGRRRR